MTDERVTHLNVRAAVHRWELFVAARELVGPAEPRGPALVVAQAAVEVGAYSDGIQWRHDFVHRAATVSEQQAEQFLTAADQLMGHMADVLAASFSAPS